MNPDRRKPVGVLVFEELNKRLSSNYVARPVFPHGLPRELIMNGPARLTVSIQGIVLVIFAIFCEKDSSSFHGVRRERRSPRNPLRQETPRNILNRRSQRSQRRKHPHFLHEYTTHQAGPKRLIQGYF